MRYGVVRVSCDRTDQITIAAATTTSTSAEAATSHHQATGAGPGELSDCGAWTGASSVMLTRVTVVVQGVRLATPSLAWKP